MVDFISVFRDRITVRRKQGEQGCRLVAELAQYNVINIEYQM